MNSQSDKEEAAGTVFKASLPFLKSDECEKVKGQLSYIVQYCSGHEGGTTAKPKSWIPYVILYSK